MMPTRLPVNSGMKAAQRGLSLITTLLFMVAALMLGVSVLSVNVMQERTIGNTKDRDLALQVAESALRDAEREVLAGGETFVFSETCDKGLCVPPSQRQTPISTSIEGVVDWAWKDDADARKYRLASKFPGLADTDKARPRYVIERVGEMGAAVGESMATGRGAPAAAGTGYRITARAEGARPETVVILQSIYTVR
jgi:type IV pilus assembly protein PilX